MTEVRNFLESNEKLADKTTIFKPEDNVKYIIYALSVDEVQSEDDVILEVHDQTEPCVLIGGNNLQLSVLSGLGRLTVLDLASGQKSEIELTEGVQTQIPSENRLYWYENTGDKPLYIKDHCDDFDWENEPTLINVVNAMLSIK